MKKTLILASALTVGLVIGFLDLRPNHSPEKSGLTPVQAKAIAAAQSHRRNYPYSLVPFGVQSVDEFRQSMSKDSALAGHFKDFQFKDARFSVLDHDTCAYVSFRKNDKIAWTQKCVTLHKGEKVLSDGKYLVRALCGNQISYRPQAPTDAVALNELGPEAMPATDPVDGMIAMNETPAIAGPAIEIGTPSAAEPAVGTPASPSGSVPPGGGLPPYGGCCPSGGPTPPPGKTGHPGGPRPPGRPGPGTPVPAGDSEAVILLAASCAAAGLFLRRR